VKVRIALFILASTGTLLVVVPACSSLPYSLDRINDPNLAACNGNVARRSYEFIISSFLATPSGLPVHNASEYTETEEADYEFIANNWIRRMLAFKFEMPGKKTQFSYLPKFSFDYSGQASTIRTGPFNFLLCERTACRGLTDPVTGKKISVGSYRLYGAQSECDWYYVRGVDDPYEDPLCRRSLYDHNRFMADTGFHDGTMLNDIYLAVPERDKARLCAMASLGEACFDPPTETSFKVYNSDPAFKTEHPFTDEFLSNNCKNCLHSSYCGRGCNERYDLIRRLKTNADLRLQWENAFSKDLFLKIGTSITKKVQGDWVIYRVEWDPSLFCKYEKPKSDLYTH
jgi:hypothetical protein